MQPETKNLKPKISFLIPFALSEVVYLIVFTLPFSLKKFYNIAPPLDYVKLTTYSARGFLAFLTGILLLYGAYLWLLNARRLPAWMPYGGLVFALTLFFSYPVLAIDLFIYALRSRGWGLYGLNPLATAPANLPSTDQWIQLAAEWRNAPSPYGPLWEWLSLGVFHLSDGSFLSQLFLLKAIAIFSYAVSIFLIGAILAKLHPQWKTAGMLAFAWNPLVLLETAQNGHNDILMAALMLAALWALVKGKRAWVMPLLAMSALVKFMTVLAAPLFALYLSSTQWAVGSKGERRKAEGERRKAEERITNYELRAANDKGHSSTLPFPHSPTPLLLRAFAHLLTFALLVILPMLPLWPGLDNWAVLNANSGAGRSALALMVLTLRDSLGLHAAFIVSRFTLYGLWAGIVLFLIWKTWRQLRITNYELRRAKGEGQRMKGGLSSPPHSPTPSLPHITALIFLSWAIFFWYVLLAAPVFHGWYLLWVLPLAVLLPGKKIGGWKPEAENSSISNLQSLISTALPSTLVFSFTALLVIPYFETLRVWFPILLENHLLGHLIGVPLLLLPPAIMFWRNTTA